MSLTLDLGSRIELVAMDPHFHEISLALYEREGPSGPHYLVHTYSGVDGARERLDFLNHAIEVLAGMRLRDGELSFPCGVGHRTAIRRSFLEAAKVSPGDAVAPRPLAIHDKKIDREVTVRGLGSGLYEVTSEGPEQEWMARAKAIAHGLDKLAQLEVEESAPLRVRFGCGQPHDALIGLLLPRALNVRMTLREEEMAASRGQLVAPSAQK